MTSGSVRALIDPAPKPGTTDPVIDLSTAPSIDFVGGGFALLPHHADILHLHSSRYGPLGSDLLLTVTNTATAHIPFRLDGFSMQQVTLENSFDPAMTYSWPFAEFRDVIDLPPDHTLSARVSLADRAWHDARHAIGVRHRHRWHAQLPGGVPTPGGRHRRGTGHWRSAHPHRRRNALRFPGGRRIRAAARRRGA